MLIRFIGSLLLLLLFTGPVLAKPINIKIVQTATDSTTENRAVDYLIKLIEERSADRIRFERRSETDGNAGLKNLLAGQNQLLLLNSADLYRELPLLQLFELPFLYDDRQQLHRVIDSEIGQQIMQQLQRHGLKPLSYWDKSFRQLAAGRPLLLPQQASGLEFARQHSLLTEAFQDKRAENTTREQGFEISLSELSRWQPDPSITDLTLSNHAATGDLLLTSRGFWDSLPEDLKVIISGAISDATVYARELMAQADRLALQQQKELGRYRLHWLTPEQRTAWQMAMMQLYRKHFTGKELQFIEMILKS